MCLLFFVHGTWGLQPGQGSGWGGRRLRWAAVTLRTSRCLEPLWREATVGEQVVARDAGASGGERPGGGGGCQAPRRWVAAPGAQRGAELAAT